MSIKVKKCSNPLEKIPPGWVAVFWNKGSSGCLRAYKQLIYYKNCLGLCHKRMLRYIHMYYVLASYCMYYIVYIVCIILYILYVLYCIYCMYYIVYIVCIILYILYVLYCIYCMYCIVYIVCIILYILYVL